MKFDFNKRYNTIALYTLIVVALGIVFYGVVLNISYFRSMISGIGSILMPFIIGFIIAYILNPVLTFIEGKIFPKLLGERVSVKARRAMAIAGTYLFALVIIVIFLMIVIPQVISSILDLFNQIPEFLANGEVILAQLVAQLPVDFFEGELVDQFAKITQQVVQVIYDTLKQLLPLLLNLTTSLLSGVITVFVALIVSIYMLSGKELFFAQIKKVLCAVLPRKSVNMLMDISYESNRVFSGFIVGKLLDSLIIGIICYVVLVITKTPDAMLVSLIVGVTNIIPYFGPFIGAIPSFFIILITSPIKALWFAVFILILQQFDGNILGPKILGDSTGLSGFWVIFSIMLFTGILGVPGMFIGVPLFAVIYTIGKRILAAQLRRKNLPESTEAYATGHPLPVQEGNGGQGNGEE